MKRILLLVAIFLLYSERADATRYWADSAGSDANACAAVDGSSDPGVYRTFSGAVSCATVSGDEVYLKAGTYTTSATITNPSSGITIRGESSTKANWPVLQPTSGSQIVTFTQARSNVTFQYIKFDGSQVSNFNNAIHSSNGPAIANITVQDFEVKGRLATTNTSPAAFTCSDTASGWIIRRGKIYDFTDDGSPGAHGFYWRCNDGLIEHVEVTNVSGYGIQFYSNGVTNISRNILRYNYFHGFTLRGPVYIQGNATDNQIYNNIFADWFNRAVTFDGTGTKLYNNTFYEASSVTAIFISGCGATCEIANNLIITAGTAISGSDADITQTTNRTGTSPSGLMIDAANGNFSLVESSAAIDAGTVISGFSAGRYVGAGVDQGALEAPIRSSAVVEDATDTIYRITFSLPTQSTRDGTGLQTCTVANIAVTVAAAGATESSCSTSGSASRVDVTLGAAVTVGQALTDAYTRSTAPTLTDNVCIGDPNTTCYNAQVRTYGAAAGTNNVDGGALPAFTQSRFRFHKLRGTEASPSLLNAAATENVSVTLPPGAAFRLRVKFRTDDDPASTTFKLRYSKDSGAYTDVPDTISTDNIGWYGVTADTDIPGAGSATTELLTSDEATNVACAVVRTSSDYPLLDFNNGESECEYVLKISTSVAVGTTYDFRVYKSDNTALDTYTVTPRLTVGSYTSFGF